MYGLSEAQRSTAMKLLDMGRCVEAVSNDLESADLTVATAVILAIRDVSGIDVRQRLMLHRDSLDRHCGRHLWPTESEPLFLIKVLQVFWGRMLTQEGGFLWNRWLVPSCLVS